MRIVIKGLKNSQGRSYDIAVKDVQLNEKNEIKEITFTNNLRHADYFSPAEVERYAHALEKFEATVRKEKKK